MSVLSNDQLMMTDDGYNIQRSLRFRASASAYLNRTNVASPTDPKKMTVSFWVKRGNLASQQPLITTDDGTYYEWFGFTVGNTLNLTRSASNGSWAVATTQVYRDPSAWYHIVLSIDMTQATNRASIYVNNVLQIAGAVGNVNENCFFNLGSRASTISSFNRITAYLNGYLAEVNFIDGQALTPSSFGQTDAVTGVWVPKKYAGTYGTNGFYLPFSDNTSATTLAYDKSGNGNNWTANNISTTAGATYDSMTDVPTLTSATAANFAVINPIKTPATNNTTSNGNLTVSTDNKAYATQAVTSGKWYWECKWDSGLAMAFGVAGANATAWITGANSGLFYYYDGTKWINGANTAYGSAFTTSDLIGVALDVDSGTVTFYKNNVSQGSITLSSMPDSGWTPCTMSGNATNVATFNFGQRPFSYTPPTGFVALNTFNLPDPTIKKPNQYMDVSTWTGDGAASKTITGVNFQPDFVWEKSRSLTISHTLYDSVRGVGATKALFSNLTEAEGGTAGSTASSQYGYVSALNSDGFTVSAGSTNANYVNATGNTYVGWQWKKGATPGFDIVTYTFGSTGIATINHNLGVVPKMIIAKRRDTTEQWLVYHASGTTQSQYLGLNTTAAAATSANLWGSSPITSSQFYFNATSGYQYVFYLFAEIAGFSKFGSYTGNGSTDGPFVYCGFRPKYVLIKSSSVATTDWYVQDATVNPSNVVTNYLYPNLSSAEQTNGLIDFTSNGFKIRNNYAPENQNGATYIYAAFAENPFKYSNAR